MEVFILRHKHHTTDLIRLCLQKCHQLGQRGAIFINQFGDMHIVEQEILVACRLEAEHKISSDLVAMFDGDLPLFGIGEYTLKRARGTLSRSNLHPAEEHAMATMDVIAPGRPATRSRLAPIGGMTFQWIMAGLTGLLLSGAVLDGWAHSHNRVDQSFFTPWHAAFYSGYASVALGLAIALVLNVRRGYSGRQALPRGYELSLLGAAIFGGGGGFDLWWHTVFGIERNMEAATSPSHLLLALGMALMFTGCFRAAWRSPTRSSSLGSLLPALLSLTYTWTILAFMTQYAHPFTTPWAAMYQGGDGQIIGIASVLIQTALMMGFVLITLRRWELPFGSLTIVFTLNAVLISVLDDRFTMIPTAFAAGLIGDLLGRWLRPATRGSWAFHTFAFALPVVLYACYFATLAYTGTIAWTLHMWLGAIFLAGGVGWLLSYLVLPPSIPGEPTITAGPQP